MLAIFSLPVCAAVMHLRFGGGGNTFYAWLLGTAQLQEPLKGYSQWFSFLAWIYLVSLIAIVLLEILHKFESARRFAGINTVSIYLCVIFGFVEGYRNSICVGMILLFFISLSYWLLPHRPNKET